MNETRKTVLEFYRDMMGWRRLFSSTWWRLKLRLNSRKFKPCIHRNDAGQMWEVYFENVDYYTTRRMIQVEAHIDQRSNRIIGFNIWDEKLTPKDQPPRNKLENWRMIR